MERSLRRPPVTFRPDDPHCEGAHEADARFTAAQARFVELARARRASRVGAHIGPAAEALLDAAEQAGPDLAKGEGSRPSSGRTTSR